MNAKKNGENQSAKVDCILPFIFDQFSGAMDVDVSSKMALFELKIAEINRLILSNNVNICEFSDQSNLVDHATNKDKISGKKIAIINDNYLEYLAKTNFEQAVSEPINKKSTVILCQEISDLDLLYKKAAAAYPVLQKVTTEIAKQSNGTTVWPKQGLKAKSRAVRKIIQKYGGDPSLQTDYIRTTIYYDSVVQVYHGLEAMKNNKLIEILRIKDRFICPKANGYQDINIRLRILTNRHIGEIQLHYRPFFKIKQFEDFIYHKLREWQLLEEMASRSFNLSLLKGISQELYRRADQEI